MSEQPIPPEYAPTGQECSDRAKLPDGWTACWSPSMGGHVGKAAVRLDEDGCVELCLWHNSQFPIEDGARPLLIHLCAPDAVAEFGRFLEGLSA